MGQKPALYDREQIKKLIISHESKAREYSKSSYIPTRVAALTHREKAKKLKELIEKNHLRFELGSKIDVTEFL